jgi:hypothetical protein
MQRIKKGIRVFLFILLILLSFVGIGLPILLMKRDRFDVFNERIDEVREKKKQETFKITETEDLVTRK